MSCVCVECGAVATSLYSTPVGSGFELTRCTICGRVVDKYVEYELSLVILDVMLHRPPAYRHLLYNEPFLTPTSVCPSHSGLLLQLRYLISCPKSVVLVFCVVFINSCVKYIVVSSWEPHGVSFPHERGSGDGRVDENLQHILWFGFLLLISAVESFVTILCTASVVWLGLHDTGFGPMPRGSTDIHSAAVTMGISESFKCLALFIFPYELCSEGGAERPVQLLGGSSEAYSGLATLYNVVGMTVVLVSMSCFSIILTPWSRGTSIDRSSTTSSTSVLMLAAVSVGVICRLACRYWLFGFAMRDIVRLGLM